METQPIQIIMMVSVVFGALLLTASSLLMKLERDGFELCQKWYDEAEEDAKRRGVTGPDPTVWDRDPCLTTLFIMIGTIFGIFASVIQLLSSVICLCAGLRWVRPWSYATLPVFIFALIAFLLPMRTKFKEIFFYKIPPGTPLAVADLIKERRLKGQFFLVISSMDIFFTFIATAVGCYISNPNNVGRIVRPPANAGYEDYAYAPEDAGAVSSPSNVGFVGNVEQQQPSPSPEPDERHI